MASKSTQVHVWGQKLSCNEIMLHPYVGDFIKDNGWIIVLAFWLYILPFFVKSKVQLEIRKMELSIAPIFIEAIMSAMILWYFSNR